MRLSERHIVTACIAAAILMVALPSMARKKKAKTKAKPAALAAADTLSAGDRKRYDYFFLEAARQRALGHHTECFELLEHARTIRPTAPEVYFYLSSCYAKMKRDSLALLAMQKATALAPENLTYAERLGEYYITLEQYDKAITQYEDIFAHNHDNTDALRILGQLYQQQKDYPRMLQTVKRLEQAEGESEQLTLSKMRVYELMNDDKAAYGELHSLTLKHPLDVSYKTMLGNWLVGHNRQQEAYKLFTEAIKDEPDNAYVQMSLYDYYNAVGQTAEADRMLDKILLGKNTDLNTKAMMLRSFIQKNEQEGGDSTKVLALFDRMLTQPSADIAELKATYMQLKNMPADSVNQALRRALQIAPDQVSARYALIQNLWQAERYDDVVALSDEAHDYNPDEMIFYYFGGMAHYLKKEEDKTLLEFQHALAQVNEKSSADLVSDLYLIMGDIYHEKGLPATAFAAYDSCLQWKADNISCLNNYAYYLSEANEQLQKAELMSYKTIKAEPANSTYLDTYAWILFMQERYAEAKTYIDQALAHLDTTQVNNTIYEHAGDICAMAGLPDQAVDHWRQAYNGGGKSDLLLQKIRQRRYIAPQPTAITDTPRQDKQTKTPAGKRKTTNTKNHNKKTRQNHATKKK